MIAAFRGEQLARLALLALLLLKLVVSGWNAHAYDNHQYDYRHHVWRARTAGLEVGKMAYNPPLYYLPTLALLPDGEAAKTADPEPLLRLLRFTNVGWLALFYACWVFVIFPRVLPDWRTAFVASALLLALPGYQKLGMLAHPDNALAALSALVLAAWLLTRERIASGRSWPAILALATCIGLVGLTRPFSILPVGLFWAVMLLEIRRGSRGGAFWSRAVVATVIAGTLAGSWYVYRAVASRYITNAYGDAYIARYAPHREGFELLPYFTTFHLPELLHKPNRSIDGLDKQNPKPKNRYANSFFTTLYSETWGDHWLYFSGPLKRERKQEEKRALFLAALPLVPLLFWRFGRGLLEAGKRVREVAPEAVIAAFFLGGAALYLYWQTGPALLPGKNSTIKFIYNAHLFPLAIALCFLVPVRRFRSWAAYVLALLLITLPVAVFTPR